MSASSKKNVSQSDTPILIRQSKAIRSSSTRGGRHAAAKTASPVTADDPFDIVVPAAQRGKHCAADFRLAREHAVELLAESIYADSSSLTLIAYDVEALSIIVATSDHLLLHVRPYCDSVRGPRVVVQSVVPPHSSGDVGLDDDAALTQCIAGRKWRRVEDVEVLDVTARHLVDGLPDVLGVSAGYRRVILPDAGDCVAASDEEIATYGDGLDVASTLLRMCRRTVVTALEELYGDRPYLVERFEIDPNAECPPQLMPVTVNASDVNDNSDDDDDDIDATFASDDDDDAADDMSDAQFVSSINLVDLIDDDTTYDDADMSAAVPYAPQHWYAPAEVILGVDPDTIGVDTSDINATDDDDNDGNTSNAATAFAPIMVRRTGCYAAGRWEDALLWCGIPSDEIPGYGCFPDTLEINDGECGSCPGGVRHYEELGEALPSIDVEAQHLLSLSCSWDDADSSTIFYRVSKRLGVREQCGARQTLRRSEPMLTVDALRACGGAVKSCVLNANDVGGWSATFELHGVTGSIERESLVSRLVVVLDCLEAPIVAAYSYPVMSSLQTTFPGEPTDQTLERIASELVELFSVAVIPAIDEGVSGSILIEERLLAREDGVRQTWVTSYDFASRKLPLDKANSNGERWYVARSPEAQWERIKSARRQPKLRGLLYTTSTYDTCDSRGHIHRDAVIVRAVDVAGYLPASTSDGAASIWNFDNDGTMDNGFIGKYDHMTRDGAIRLGHGADDATNADDSDSGFFSAGNVISGLIERFSDIWKFDEPETNDADNDADVSKEIIEKTNGDDRNGGD